MKKGGGKYKCAKCGSVFDEFQKGVIRCPECSFKIMAKLRQPVIKKIQAR